MSYYQDDREYFYASRPGHSSARRISYDGLYHEERPKPALRLPAPDYNYGGHGEKRKKNGHLALMTETPLPSPASTLSRKSSRVSFSDYDDAHAYHSHQRASTLPPNHTKHDDYFDLVAATEQRKKKRNKTLLYAGLACVTTVAASNNIYQSTKAHMGRRYELQRGEMDLDEATKLRKRGLMMDLFSAGVGAICINNTFKGWKRYEALKKEEKEADAMLRKKRRARKEQEEEEYFSSMR